MAKDELQPILQLGPFLGMDNADGQPQVQPGYAILANNVNTDRRKGSLMPERGRVFLADFASYMAQINVLTSVTITKATFAQEFDQLLIQGSNSPLSLVTPPTPITVIYDIATSTTQIIANALPYTQAVQYGQVIYTNGGQRFFAGTLTDPSYPKFYTWQYTGFATPFTLTTSGAGGNIGPETRFYVTTQVTVMPDGTISETSPENFPTPGSITTGAGTTNSITLTPTGAVFANTNRGPNGQNVAGVDGTSYTTNIYAQSSLQAGYFLVGNASSNTPFVDTLSDAVLATRPPLLTVNGSAFQMDPPPLGPIPVGGGRNVNNFPYIKMHKNCMFIFTHIDSVIVAGSPPSTQLWYSQVAKPWAFSADTRALLLTDNVELGAVTGIGISQIDYNNPRGDYAKALASAGSYLLCVKKREQWLVYGDGTDQAPFTQQRILDFGGQSIRAVTSCVGGAFVKTENGVYFFDGQSPQYEEARFRTVNADPRIASEVPDAAHSVGVFSNMAYYLFYPTLKTGYVYNTQVGDWISKLSYSPFSEDAVFFTPADQASLSGSAVNRTVAVRMDKPTSVDFLFADDNYDLGQPMAFSWQGPETDNPGTEYKKEYSALTVYAPIQQGTITVELSVDGVSRIIKTFDLSAPRPLIANFSVQGYSANLFCSVQGAPAPALAPEIWSVKVWGITPPARKLETPQ